MTIQTLHDLSGLLLSGLDLSGTAVFAISGALAAGRARQTLLTFAFFAIATGTGGSTVSDLLIGAPVVWVHDPAGIFICLVVALLTWVTPLAFWPSRAIDWFDALGVAAYGVVGAAKALSYGIPPLSAAIMGVFTACLGGVVRDILAGQPSIIVRPELYVTAVALAAGMYVVLVALGVAPAGYPSGGGCLGWRRPTSYVKIFDQLLSYDFDFLVPGHHSNPSIRATMSIL